LPVIGSQHGSVGAIIDDGRTGLHVRPGDPDDLATKVEWAFAHPRELAAMRTNARAAFEARYTPDVNYELLMGIYDRARRGARVRSPSRPRLRDAAASSACACTLRATTTRRRA